MIGHIVIAFFPCMNLAISAEAGNIWKKYLTIGLLVYILSHNI